jgi:lysyl-tRNA synthetase class 2
MRDAHAAHRLAGRVGRQGSVGRGRVLWGALAALASLGPAIYVGGLGVAGGAGVVLLAGLAVVGLLARRERRPAARARPPLRRLVRPAPCADGHTAADHGRAATVIESHASDSLDPFALRHDKAFHFAHGGVLAYRTLRETAVVAGDPVGPAGSGPAIVNDFRQLAAARGWDVVLTGVSSRNLDGYRSLGLRALQIGNEAVVDPAAFSLEGRAIRKVRQSVTRVQRRGWTIELVDGGRLRAPLIDELEAIELAWWAAGARAHGFAMTLGRLWGADEDAAGLYVIARDPDRSPRAFLHFVAYRDGLSLDVMRRLGDEPNGLSEALVVAALQHARAEGVREVSLNFAGFAHVMAARDGLTWSQRAMRVALSGVHGRFQLERLVRFNDKFGPAWQPRFLVYGSRARLPLAALRVLQAEGYMRAPAPRPLSAGWRPLPRPVTQPVTIVQPGASR